MKNAENKDKATINSNEKINQKYNFVEQKNNHEKVEAEIVSDIINDVPYEHVKTDQEYVQQTADDVQTIEYQTTKYNNDFINTAIEFNKVDISAANQKNNLYSDLFDAVVDLPPKKVSIGHAPKTEDIFIDDDLFSDVKIR